MTICGYNEEMGVGLKQLFDGMYKAIADKALEEKKTISEIVARELVEIPAVNSGIIERETNLSDMFLGLNGIALPLFTAAVQSANSDLEVKEKYFELVDSFLQLLIGAEEQSMSMPYLDNHSTSISQRAKEIGTWIAEESRRKNATLLS